MTRLWLVKGTVLLAMTVSAGLDSASAGRLPPAIFMPNTAAINAAVPTNVIALDMISLS
jgi:hypothetical protein